MPTTFSTRPWRPGDLPLLWNMLYESIHVRNGYDRPARSILDEPDISHYLSEFGRSGDDAQIAERASDGLPIGAAWCRKMTTDDPGYGFVDDATPELGSAVVDGWRGRGVGSRLIRDLLARHPSMSLSVDNDNEGAKRLYERLGFVVVAIEGTASTMLRR